MMQLLKRIAQELRKPLSLIAALLTLLNLAYSVRFFPGSGLSISHLSAFNPLLRLLVFVVLTGTVAATFAWLLAALRYRGEGFVAVWIFVVSLLCAWTALFDVQWLLTGPAVSLVTHAGLLLGSSVAALLCIYFVGIFSERAGLGRASSTYMWLVMGFAIMYFAVALVPLFKTPLDPFQ